MIEIPEVPLWKERQTQELHKRIAELEAAGQKQTAIHSQAMQEMNDMLVARDKRIAGLEAELINVKSERDRLAGWKQGALEALDWIEAEPEDPHKVQQRAREVLNTTNPQEADNG